MLLDARIRVSDDVKHTADLTALIIELINWHLYTGQRWSIVGIRFSRAYLVIDDSMIIYLHGGWVGFVRSLARVTVDEIWLKELV